MAPMMPCILTCITDSHRIFNNHSYFNTKPSLSAAKPLFFSLIRPHDPVPDKVPGVSWEIRAHIFVVKLKKWLSPPMPFQ